MKYYIIDDIKKFIEENGITKHIPFSSVFMKKYDITLKNCKSKINLVMLMDF